MLDRVGALGGDHAGRGAPAKWQCADTGGVPGSNSSAASAGSKSATADPNYVIGPQDVLDISVWKEDQLTKTVPVRPDGKISMPLLNDVQAAGLTPTQLAKQITESLKKFVTDPQVTVIVREINSQRVYLLGEVARAGAYPLLPGHDGSAGVVQRGRIHAVREPQEDLRAARGERQAGEIPVQL